MGADYEEMQECLRGAYDDLGAECRSYTYAASVCDFKDILDVCPRVHSSADAAECVEMVLEQHRHGRTVPKNFLNMSHAHCTDVLRGLPRRDNAPAFDAVDPNPEPARGLVKGYGRATQTVQLRSAF